MPSTPSSCVGSVGSIGVGRVGSLSAKLGTKSKAGAPPDKRCGPGSRMASHHDRSMGRSTNVEGIVSIDTTNKPVQGMYVWAIRREDGSHYSWSGDGKAGLFGLGWAGRGSGRGNRKLSRNRYARCQLRVQQRHHYVKVQLQLFKMRRRPAPQSPIRSDRKLYGVLFAAKGKSRHAKTM